MVLNAFEMVDILRRVEEERDAIRKKAECANSSTATVTLGFFGAAGGRAGGLGGLSGDGGAAAAKQHAWSPPVCCVVAMTWCPGGGAYQ